MCLSRDILNSMCEDIEILASPKILFIPNAITQQENGILSRMWYALFNE